MTPKNRAALLAEERFKRAYADEREVLIGDSAAYDELSKYADEIARDLPDLMRWLRDA